MGEKTVPTQWATHCNKQQRYTRSKSLINTCISRLKLLYIEKTIDFNGRIILGYTAFGRLGHILKSKNKRFKTNMKTKILYSL